MSNPIPAMVEALELEAATIRKKGGGTQVELRGGELVSQTAGTWLYRFLAADETNLRDDTPVRVTVDQEEASGVLVSYRDGIVLVALEKDLGPKIASARLVSNDAFLIERLIERLSKVESGEIQFNRAAADRALGLAKPTTADSDADPIVLADGALNSDQSGAVRRSLGSDTTFVWGPPGTGKTTTLARIVEAHYRAGRSVLVVSNTNIAVDTALERVAERLKGETEFHNGLVIRQGPVVKEELRKAFGPHVILEEIVARLGQGLTDERTTLSAEARPLKAEEQLIITQLKELDLLATSKATLAQHEKARSSISDTIESREKETKAHLRRIEALTSDLERAKNMNAIKRMFSGRNPEKLQRERAAAERQVQATQAAAQTLKADLPKLEAAIHGLLNEIEVLVGKLNRHPPGEQLKGRLEIIRKRLRETGNRIVEIDKALASRPKPSRSRRSRP